MEENNAVKTDMEPESSGTDTEVTESFLDTVSGNDAGTDTATDGQGEALPEDNGEDGGQNELLESLNALVEALTPSEEDVETEEGTETETGTLPSEKETATLELLEKIYAEIAAGRTAEDLYHEAWVRSQRQVQTAAERSETLDTYMTVLLIGIFFLCALISGIKLAQMIWGRFL